MNTHPKGRTHPINPKNRHINRRSISR